MRLVRVGRLAAVSDDALCCCELDNARTRVAAASEVRRGCCRTGGGPESPPAGALRHRCISDAYTTHSKHPLCSSAGGC